MLFSCAEGVRLAADDYGLEFDSSGAAKLDALKLTRLALIVLFGTELLEKVRLWLDTGWLACLSIGSYLILDLYG